eukprot:3149104-Pyramimonas_sp.AAC.1
MKRTSALRGPRWGSHKWVHRRVARSHTATVGVTCGVKINAGVKIYISVGLDSYIGAKSKTF